MGAVASILVAVGIIALICAVYLKVKAGRVAKTPLVKTGQAAQQGPGGAVSVEGNVLCQQPLIAPYSGQPCLYCKISITAEWKQGETKKTKELRSDKLAA